MRLLYISLLLGLLNTPCITHTEVRTQDKKAESTMINGQSFAAIRFVEGLPKFPPVSRMLVSRPHFATIRLADSLGAIYVCRGMTRQGETQFVLLRNWGDQNWSMTTLDFNQDSTTLPRTSIDLTLLPERETPFPLDIRLNSQKNLLLYRWLLSPEIAGIPGGVPTPAEVVLDRGKPLFEFSVTDLSGKVVHSSDLRGQVTVINWWAIWCSGCVAEIPGYNELVNRFRSRVDFLGIAINTPDEVKTFLARQPFSFRQTVAPDSMLRVIRSGIPRTILVDRQGLVVFDKTGGSAESYKEVENAIEELLGNSPD